MWATPVIRVKYSGIFGEGQETCAWRITSHAAIKVRRSFRMYIFRANYGLEAWSSAVSLLILKDLISSSGLGMRKRLLFSVSCSVSKSMALQFEWS